MKKALLKRALCFGFALANLFACPALANNGIGDWAGSYLGGNIGYGWSNFRGDYGTAGPNGTGSSLLGGGDIGNNWQFDRVVLGIEADATKFDLQSHNPSATFDEDWMATARGRAGYALGQYTLPYVTMGLGLTDATLKAPGLGSDTRVQPGIAAGGGVDFLLSGLRDDWSRPYHPDNWFGRIEYMYTDVPKDQTYLGGVPAAGGSGNNIIRVGLNYKF